MRLVNFAKRRYLVAFGKDCPTRKCLASLVVAPADSPPIPPGRLVTITINVRCLRLKRRKSSSVNQAARADEARQGGQGVPVVMGSSAGSKARLEMPRRDQ